VVSEAGASVYSVSALASQVRRQGGGIGWRCLRSCVHSQSLACACGQELPTLPASLRGAVSIGRRVLDPLAELVKLDATTLGVGMYQKDLKPALVKQACAEVVESVRTQACLRPSYGCGGR
jgi:transcriptional accessory protein Tex/SPT6